MALPVCSYGKCTDLYRSEGHLSRERGDKNGNNTLCSSPVYTWRKFLHNLGDGFVSLLVEPIAGKNMSPPYKRLWQFSKNVLVVEKSQCKALSIGRHLEISSLLLMSAENIETLTFVSIKFCF